LFDGRKQQQLFAAALRPPWLVMGEPTRVVVIAMIVSCDPTALPLRPGDDRLSIVPQ
jgi:hypothetical protein